MYASSAFSAASHAAYNCSSQTPHAPFNPVSNVDGIGPEKLPRGQAEIQSLPEEKVDTPPAFSETEPAQKSAALGDVIGAHKNGASPQFELLERRNIARAYNSCIVVETMDLMPLPDSEGSVPSLFPQTYSDFFKLKGDQVISLLHTYQIHVSPVADQACNFQKLSTFCGINTGAEDYFVMNKTVIRIDRNVTALKSMMSSIMKHLGIPADAQPQI